jgi:hypothetical protein
MLCVSLSPEVGFQIVLAGLAFRLVSGQIRICFVVYVRCLRRAFTFSLLGWLVKLVSAQFGICSLLLFSACGGLFCYDCFFCVG